MPPSLGYGMTGGEKGIPPFVSVAMDVELLDLYHRNYTPYYSKMISKQQEYPERNATYYERWLGNCAEAKKNGKPEPKFYPPYIQTARVPYEFMKKELEEKGIEGYSEEEREQLRSEEEHRKKMYDHDISSRRRREDKLRDLASRLKAKKRLVQIQKEKEIEQVKLETNLSRQLREEQMGINTSNATNSTVNVNATLANKTELAKNKTVSASSTEGGNLGQDADEDSTEEEEIETPEMIEEKKKIAEIEDRYNALIKKQHKPPLRLTEKQADEVEKEKQRKKRAEQRKERMRN